MVLCAEWGAKGTNSTVVHLDVLGSTSKPSVKTANIRVGDGPNRLKH